MKLNPAGHRVLIKPDKIEEEQLVDKELETLRQHNFEIVKPDGQKLRDKQGTDSGVVVAVGPNAWRHDQKVLGLEQPTPWAKVGDRVLFGRYAGKLIVHPETKEEFMIINDEDIQLVITEE